MQDMLVRLLDLPDVSQEEQRLFETDQTLFRRPIPPERGMVVDWVGSNFSTYWADEVQAAFASLPVHCFIAQRGQELLGFGCYECTAKNFFGPTGVLPSHRGKGIGKVLLVKSLLALRELGYAYAVIGGVGPASYYERTVGAKIIEGSEKGIYQHLLKPSK